MAHSTLMAVMARMAAYTGQVITWEQALNSAEELKPAAYDWARAGRSRRDPGREFSRPLPVVMT